VTSDKANFADEHLKSQLMTGNTKYQPQSDLILFYRLNTTHPVVQLYKEPLHRT